MWPWLFGAILLIAGLLIIAFHQYWRSPAAIIVSAVGWFLAIRGVLLLTVPQAYDSAGDAVYSGATALIWVVFVGLALSGAYLTYVGWKPQPATSSARRAERGQRRIVIRLLGDLWHQLRVGDVAVGADDHDGTGEQSGERSVGDGDAVILTEVVTERRRALHVLDTLGATETRLGERQVVGHVDHGKTASGGALVEGAHTRGADRCVHRRKEFSNTGLPLNCSLLTALRSDPVR